MKRFVVAVALLISAALLGGCQFFDQERRPPQAEKVSLETVAKKLDLLENRVRAYDAWVVNQSRRLEELERRSAKNGPSEAGTADPAKAHLYHDLGALTLKRLELVEKMTQLEDGFRHFRDQFKTTPSSNAAEHAKRLEVLGKADAEYAKVVNEFTKCEEEIREIRKKLVDGKDGSPPSQEAPKE